MDAQIRRELRILKGYAIVVTLLLGTISVTAFQQATQKQRFTEIDVERINVVEKNGNLRMVISNRERSIGPIYKGKPFGYAGGTRPGIIFFNDEGTENGGLTFTGHVVRWGERVTPRGESHATLPPGNGSALELVRRYRLVRSLSVVTPG